MINDPSPADTVDYNTDRSSRGDIIAGLGARVPSDRHPEARHQQQTRPSSGQGEEDGEAGPPQDGPHPHLRQVHGCALAQLQGASLNIVFLLPPSIKQI